MNTHTEITMSPAEILAAIDDSAERMEKMCRDFLFRESISAPELRRARTAVAALIKREAALIAERDALAAALRDFVHCSDSHQSLSRAANELLARAEARNV